LDKLNSAFEEIERDVERVAKKRALTKRHDLEAHDVYGTKQETLTEHSLG
jgi:hypothetical protein